MKNHYLDELARMSGHLHGALKQVHLDARLSETVERAATLRAELCCDRVALRRVSQAAMNLREANLRSLQ